jgi:hypothetical protein
MMLGYSDKSAVNKLESGQGLSLSIAASLAAIFGQTIDWLVTGSAEGKIILEVAEAPENYGKSDRLKLVHLIKELAREAPDDIIDALLKSVVIFRRIVREENKKGESR